MSQCSPPSSFSDVVQFGSHIVPPVIQTHPTPSGVTHVILAPGRIAPKCLSPYSLPDALHAAPRPKGRGTCPECSTWLAPPAWLAHAAAQRDAPPARPPQD